MLCKVRRPFDGPQNIPLEVGSIVDTKDWPQRNRRNLIDRRFLQPLELDDQPVNLEAITHTPEKRGPGRPPKPIKTQEN